MLGAILESCCRHLKLRLPLKLVVGLPPGWKRSLWAQYTSGVKHTSGKYKDKGFIDTYSLESNQTSGDGLEPASESMVGSDILIVLYFCTNKISA